jgi:LacI family repressor for deo operon, udp, cdd, tsx, nupC, and nupG
MAGIKDVAQRAGVSIATVSRVFDNPAIVAAQTRERVISAADSLGYRPNAMARRLRSSKAEVILVIVNDLVNPFIAEVARGIENAAEAVGVSIILGDAQRDAGRERRYADLVRARQADGIIQFGPRIPFDEGERLPMVTALECVRGSPYSSVQIDNVAAAKAVIEHLLEIGHFRIGAIAGPLQSTQSADRLIGVQMALSRAGLVLPEDRLTTGEYSASSGLEAAMQLLQTPERPTALFCFNDLMAIGAMQAARSLGLRVPEDLSIVGFDDMFLASAMNPPLSTVRQPARELGAKALELVIEAVERPDIARTQAILPYELVWRSSVLPNSPRDDRSAR